MTDLAKPRVRIEHLRGRRLGVVIALEQVRRAHQADVIIPHDGPRPLLPGDAERVLEDLEALPARLLEKRLLLAVVRDVPRELADLAHGRMDLEAAVLLRQLRVLVFAGRVSQLSADFSSDEDGDILGHFLLLGAVMIRPIVSRVV